MSDTAFELLAKLAALAPTDRYEIAYRLLDTLAAEAEPAWDNVWAAEVQRRTETIESGGATEEPADNAISDLRKKYT